MQHQSPAVAGLLSNVDKGSNPRRVDELEPAQVDAQSRVTILLGGPIQAVMELLFQGFGHGRGVEVVDRAHNEQQARQGGPGDNKLLVRVDVV